MISGGVLSELVTGGDLALQELREAYSQKNLVVFAGVGISTAAGLPSWTGLVQALANHPRMSQASKHREEMLALLHSHKHVDALTIAEQVLGRLEFATLVEHYLNDQDLPVPPLAQAIAALAPRLRAVLTTNLDHTLEHAFSGRWPPIWTTLPGLQRRGFILKLHGTLLDRSSWVFTRADYDHATWGHGGTRAILAQFFQSFPLLFVGHDMEGEDLENILSQVRALAGDHPPRNFALVPAGMVQGVRRGHLERAGVHLIEYANSDGQHAQAIRFLAALAASAPGSASPTGIAHSGEGPFPSLEYFNKVQAHFFGRAAKSSAALQLLGNVPQGHVRWLQAKGASGTGKSSFARAGLLPKVRLDWVDGAPQARAPGSASSPAVSHSGEGPFPGLEYFDEDRTHVFFGRETEISAALQLLGNTLRGHVRWLQVEGASGTGKSSFARAGLLPKVRLGWVDGAPQTWSIAVLRPGRKPLLSLAQAMFDALRPERGSLDEFARDLRKSNTALTSFVRQHAPKGNGVLLLVDQFEELFTLAEEDSAQAFDQCLAEALRDTGFPFYLVTTTRSDFLGHFDSLPCLAPLLRKEASRYPLASMSTLGFRAAITKPAEQWGLRWEAGLPERLLEDVSGIESGLPLLAHALRVLWTERSGQFLTHERYDALGGTLGALTRSADQLLETLGADGKERARRLLLALVTLQRGKVSRRALTRVEALEAAGDDSTAERVLTRLSGGRDPTKPDTAPASVRLIVVLQAEGQDRVDLVHEALLTRWTNFGKWIEEARQTLDRSEELESAARSWERAGSLWDDLPSGGKLAYLQEASPITRIARQYLWRAEKRERETHQRERRRKRTLAVMTVSSSLGFVATSVLAYYAFHQRSLAQQRLSEALAVANKVIFAFDRQLAPLGGTAEVRKELLESSFKLLETLRADVQDDVGVLQNLMAAHTQRGDLEFSRDNQERAHQEYKAGLDIARQLAALDPDSSIAIQDVSVGLDRLGKLAQKQGNMPDARSFLQQSLDINQSLAKRRPSDASLQLNLSISLYEIGELAQQEGDLIEARSFFQQSLEILQALTTRYPSDAYFQHNLSLSLGKLGELAHHQGHLDEARSFLQRSINLLQPLAAAHPLDASLRSHLSDSLEMLGGVADEQGLLDETRSCFQQSRDLRQTLSEADPLDAQLRLNWVTIELRLAYLELSTKNFQASRAHRSNAERLLDDSRQLQNLPRYKELRALLADLPR